MKTYWRAAPVAAAVLTAAPTALLLPAAADDEPKPIKLVNLDCNTKADEDDPHVSSSGAHLYYAYPTPTREFDLMVSKRSSAGKWAAGKAVGGYIQTKADEHGCFLTRQTASFPQYLFVVTK